MSIVAGKPLVTPFNPNKFKPSDEEIKQLIDECYEESDPTVPAWAKQPNKPPYTAEEVGAVTEAQAIKKITDHNSSVTSHNDLRLAFQQLLLKVNNFLDVDEETANQLSELLGLIRENASDIESITSGKVNVADIIDDLVTNVSNKPLSAAQGVVLKGLIDALSTNKLDASKLTEAINTALAQAKASGEFKGDPGYTPVKGTDYFTSADKTEMVNTVIAALPTTEGVGF